MINPVTKAILSKRLKIEYFLPVLVVLIFGILIGSLEWGIRARWPDLIFRSMDDEFDIFCRFDLPLGRWHRKNFAHAFGDTRVTHNKNGLRDKDVPYKNKNGKKRILVLGDSVVWGLLVNDGETFCDVLENKLAHTDVINMGTSGYGTGEEFLLLRHEGLAYHPDLVILFFFLGNDVQNNLKADSFSSYPVNVFYLENDQLKIKPIQINFARRVGLWLNENSYLANFVRKKMLGHKDEKLAAAETKEPNWAERLNQRNQDSIPIDYSRYKNLTYLEGDKNVPADYFDGYENRMLSPIPLPPKNYYGVELTKKIIEEIKKQVVQNQARFLVVLSPSKTQLGTSDYYCKNPLTKELLKFFHENNIDAVDLLPIFLEKGWKADDLFIDDAHYSVHGHQRVADILYQKIKLLGLWSTPVLSARTRITRFKVSHTEAQSKTCLH